MTTLHLSPSPTLSSSFTAMSGSRHSSTPSVGGTFSNSHALRMNATNEDRSWAQRLISEHCTTNNRFKNSTAVLASIVRGGIPNATPGLVEALYEQGADVNWERRRSGNLVKMLRGRDQEDVRSRFLEDAIVHCSDDVVSALAMRADQHTLNQALPAAIRRKDASKTRILLARGADATPLCAEFLAVVDSCSDELVDVLLRMRGGACQGCRDKGLVSSSASGQTAKAAMLLKNGASVVFEDAAALRAAIHGGTPDIAEAILSRQELRCQGGLLDSVVEEAYANEQNHILRVCLQAGARGPATDATLLKSVDHGRLELVETLIRHGASVEHQAGAPVHSAIRSRNPKLLQAILRGRPSHTTMMAAVDEYVMLKDMTVMHQMLGPVVASGLAGSDWTGMVLLRILAATTLVGEQDHRLSLARLLTEKGRTNVNIQDGRPIALAAAKGWSNILSLLLSCEPLFGSLQAALAPSMALADPKLRLQVVDMLLVAGLGNCSADDAKSLKATVVRLAAEYRCLDVLEHVAQSPLPKPVVLSGFSAAISATQWHTSRGLGVIRLLLHLGASGPEVDKAFCRAAQVYERDAFELIAPYINITILGELLDTVTQRSTDWLSPHSRNLWLIHYLLEHGAKAGSYTNLAFLRAVSAYLAGSSSEALVETFLTVGLADVNFQFGAALKMAIRAGNLNVFKMLFSRGANKETLVHAFHEAITSPLDEDTVFGLIDILACGNGTVTVSDFKTAIRLGSPIHDCLAVHPESAKLVRRLADLGCDPDGQVQAELYDGHGLEFCTPLLWALCPSTERQRPVSSAAIEALIKAKAQVNRISPVSKTTPLILAGFRGRTDVVAWLIKAGADTRPRDCFDNSALFYASRKGFLDTVKVLLKAPFKPNDGSLHEAARNLHSEIVDALIKTGKHDANYNSSKPDHEGRTPLQELAYHCNATRTPIEIETTLDALRRAKALVTDKWHGSKNALFLALENQHPYPVTRALLDIMTPQEINHEENVYKDLKTGYFYSPTMYLSKQPAASPTKEAAQRNWLLLDLLKAKNCADRFYAGLGQDQPAGAVGLPDGIAKDHKRRQDEAEKRRKRQHEHEEELRRQDELNMHRMVWDQSRHQVRQEHETEKVLQQVHHTGLVHQNKMRQQEQATSLQYQAAASKIALTEQAQQRAQQAKTQSELLSQQLLARKHQMALEFQHRTAEEKTLQMAMVTEAAKADDQRKLLYQHQAGVKQVALKKSMNKLAKEDDGRKLLYQHQAGAKQVALKKSMNKLAKEDDGRKLQHRQDMARLQK